MPVRSKRWVWTRFANITSHQVRVVRLIPDDSGFGLGNSGYNFGSDHKLGSTQ
jgi:hypothetical protein